MKRLLYPPAFLRETRQSQKVNQLSRTFLRNLRQWCTPLKTILASKVSAPLYPRKLCRKLFLVFKLIYFGHFNCTAFTSIHFLARLINEIHKLITNQIHYLYRLNLPETTPVLG